MWYFTLDRLVFLVVAKLGSYFLKIKTNDCIDDT